MREEVFRICRFTEPRREISCLRQHAAREEGRGSAFASLYPYYITGSMTNRPKADIMEVQRLEKDCNYGTCNR